MKSGAQKQVRCAIYTRVSTDQGLEQDFNSLDAQYDSAQAYIRSQAHAGWILIRTRYDDGGFSGGTTDRPALQRLLEDVTSRKVDVIVVYKVDRLTRSLADFAKLVELFDRHNVSFVSVTQQFNTTTSMGRLTLNVLLSFAQFEREVTAERIRDKIDASKRKGLWVGGMVPLGYKISDRKVVVIEEEAERVQTIFRRYVEVGGLNPLMEELRERRIFTKVRTLSTGRTVGGIAFTRGSLGHLLRNRFYIGEIEYNGEILPGEQPPILDRELFEAVQRKLDEQRTARSKTRGASEALLTGRIYDDAGYRMTPSVARKAGVRYRYYVSSALVQGRGKLAGTVSRVSAPEIEALVLEAVRQHIQEATSLGDQELLRNDIVRVDVGADQLTVTLTKSADQDADANGDVLKVAWKKAGMKRERQILLPASATDTRPIRSETRTALVCAIARGRRWLDELVTGTVSDVETIAAREMRSVRHVNMTISLAFLAPSLVSAAIEGRLPRGIGIARLRDAPAEWSRQYGMLGLSYPPAAEAAATC